MDDVKACRICLEMDVTLHSLHSNSLERYYEIMTGTNPLVKSQLPMYACYECAAMLKKFYMFRQKSLQGQEILQGILQICGKITEEDIKEIDRRSFHLNSSLTANFPCVDNYTAAHETNDYLNKQEPYEADNFEDIVSESFDNYCLSDNETLPMHKSIKYEKIKEEDMIVIEIKEEKPEEPYEADNIEVIVSERLDNDWLSNDEPLSMNKRRKYKMRKEEEVAIPANKSENPEEVEVKRTLKSVMNFPKGCVDTLNFKSFVTIITLTEDEQREELRKRQESETYKKSNLKCELCFRGFLDTQTWQQHAKKHDETSGSVECEICKLRFKTRRILNKHVVGHAKKYMCKYCPYVSRNVSQAKQHLFWHQGVTYKCPYCDEMLSKWTSYLSHVRMKHPSDFICGFCGYSFVSKLGLGMHKNIKHKDLPEPGEAAPHCAPCDVRFASDEAHARHLATARRHTQAAENKNGCRECGEAFPTAKELRAHTSLAHGRNTVRSRKSTDNRTWPFTCPHCSEEIANARMCYSHFMRFHPDKDYPIIKRHVCEVCGRGFRKNSDLIYHKRTHGTEKMFKCKECGKSFYNRGNLRKHGKSHSEQRPYVCSVCEKGFKSKGSLDRHFRCHTGEKPYKCEVCGKAFGQSTTCKLHVRTVHMKLPDPYSRRKKEKRKQEKIEHDR